MSNTELQVQDCERISRDPLDGVKIGDWYWVTYTDWHEQLLTELFCIENIGSNHVAFTRYGGERHAGSCDVKVHFDEFASCCKHEPEWREKLQAQMVSVQKAMQEAMQALLTQGRNLALLPAEVTPGASEQPSSLLPAVMTTDPKQHKKALIKFRDKSLPASTKTIEALADEYASIAKSLALTDIVKLQRMKVALGVVNDKIFTIELYCGLQETVHQIATGEPAPVDTSIAVYQQMLYMDEETLFDYRSGGMDFNGVDKFDAWVVEPKNLERILPSPRGIVAFRVRRNDKDYGHSRNLAASFAHACWNDANAKTYLLIRNGGNVYRIQSAIDFAPRLIPKRDEIGEEQFLKEIEYYEKGESFPFGKQSVRYEKITPDDLEYDERIKKMNAIITHYNRIVILLQGLLDRSTVFMPHSQINLTQKGATDRWLHLIRDEENALPNRAITWKDYLAAVNTRTKPGEWIYSDVAEDKDRRYYRPDARPSVIQVSSVQRDGSVWVKWPWIRTGYEKQDWRGDYTWGTWGEWPTKRFHNQLLKSNEFINLNHYQLDDYKQFLCDRTLQGQYLEWAPYLLRAEDWKRKQLKGMDVVTAGEAEGKVKQRIIKTVDVVEEVD